MKRTVFIGAAVSLVAVLSVVIAMRMRDANASDTRSGNGHGSNHHAIKVKVVKPQRGGLERLSTQPASIESWEQVDLFPQASGLLKKQEVDIQSFVKRNQLLCEIYAPDLVADQAHAAATLKQKKAQAKQAEARIETVAAQIEYYKNLVKQRQAELLAAQAYLLFRDKELIRFTELAMAKAIDIRIVDEESDRYDAALSRRDAGLEGINTAQSNQLAKEAELKQAHADFEAAKAEIDVARAALEKADVMVSFTKILAPFDGVITRRYFNNEAFIRTAERGGQFPVLIVKRTDKMRLVVMVPDTDAPFVDKGNKADLWIPTLRKTFPATVDRVAYSEDKRDRTMRVECDMYNKKGDYELRDGMYGEISIHIKGAPKDALTIPSTCLQGAADEDETPETAKKGKGRHVFVVRNGKVHLVPVKIGIDNGDRVEILKGLSSDDQVVSEQSSTIGEGSQVQPMEDENPHHSGEKHKAVKE